MSIVGRRDEGTKAHCQHTPCHIGEREQEQSSSTECVYGPYCRKGEDEVNKSKSERSPKAFELRSSCILEDCRTVERKHLRRISNLFSRSKETPKLKLLGAVGFCGAEPPSNVPELMEQLQEESRLLFKLLLKSRNI